MTINPQAVTAAEQVDVGAANLFAGTTTYAPGAEGMLPITRRWFRTTGN